MHLADTFIQSDLQCIQIILFFSVHVHLLLVVDDVVEVIAVVLYAYINWEGSFFCHMPL